MSVVIVMGPACSGKSTFIKEYFKDRTIIDLYDFQSAKNGSLSAVWLSYEDCRDALVEALKSGKSVVLEHTLLLRKRRPMYIEAIRSVTDEPIDVYCMVPSIDTLYERIKKRNVRLTRKQAEEALNMLELPVLEEGFENIYLIGDGIDEKRKRDKML